MRYDSLEDFPFHFNLTTRWKDMDLFGHVNNAVYLTYIEDARITLFKQWNLRHQNRSIIVASVKIDFLSQLQHPSDVIIGQRISRIGNSSFDILSVIYLKGAQNPSASAVVTCVCYDYEHRNTLPVYDEIKSEYAG